MKKTTKKVVASQKAAVSKKTAVVKKTTTPKKAVGTKKNAVSKKAAPKKVAKTAPSKKTVVSKKTAPLKKAVLSKKATASTKAAVAKKTTVPVLKKTTASAKPITTKPVVTQKPAQPAFNEVAIPPEVTPPVLKNASLSHDKNLTVTEVEAYRVKLMNLRARLSGDVMTMTDAALNKNRLESSGDLSVMPIHMADVGTDNFEQEQTLSFMQNESGILDQVDEALERIKDGTFGLCEDCGCRIPKVRLNFLPYTAMCVKCADRSRREEN